jgi:dATP pyrophosphohydrolase
MAIVSSTMVEVCIFAVEGNSPRYLLLRRSKEESVYPDLWQFVTGSIEKAEKASDAALRELAEETGLQPNAVWVVPYVSTFYDPGWDSLNLMPVFAAEVGPREEPLLSEEHTAWGWYSFEEALAMLVWPGQKEALRIVHNFIANGSATTFLRRVK